MMGQALKSFDFDEWMKLAASDPEGFENRRRQVVEEAILSAPQAMQPRLRALQWRIDMERDRASNPLSACIRLCNMMWTVVYGDKGLMTAIGTLTGATQQAPRPAEVVRFARREKVS